MDDHPRALIEHRRQERSVDPDRREQVQIECDSLTSAKPAA
jgi:hypothetical protein